MRDPYIRTITTCVSLGLLLVGCARQANSPASATVAGKPMAQPVLQAWESGDKSMAVSRFLETDWSARPLFAADSTLGLNETQFRALSEAQRQSRGDELLSQADALKQLGSAVRQTGREAAAKGDTAQARKCFASLKQCGTALNSRDCVDLVRLVGKAFEKMADGEMAKLPQ